ncbi:dihydrolipoyl dehydrogenase [Paenibacillus sp. GCM10027626]|uniref:dihydrolipoyl dehydrogenase n=1 Tax=Paenibacillus sp. GCM10027626 TaxID=3273411 RepID=UPI0036253B1A
MTTITCDTAVLGGGIAGYTAAIRAAQAGKKVILIEREKLGGTCLHRGCIPTKALLRSAEVYATLMDAASYGIEVDAAAVKVNYAGVKERQEQTVEQLYKGLQYLMRKNGITIMKGNGRVIGPSIFSPRSGSIAVELDNGEMETVVPTNLIIATGSRPRQLSALPADGKGILTSDEVLAMEQLPSSIIIVGGGVIGVEWASLLADFGVEVTIVESADRILPAEDKEIVNELAKQLQKRKVKIYTGMQLLTDTYTYEDGQARITVQKGEEKLELQAACMLVSIGRQANIEGIGLENTDITVSDGVIKVNRYGQTTEPHIYAVGDVVGGMQLAHAAAHEATIAIEHLTGGKAQTAEGMRMPRCIYSHPEVAAIGLTEEAARAQGKKVKIGKIPFSAIGKAVVLGQQEGFAKVIADKETNDIIGVHLVGAHATDLIAEASLAMLLDATPWEVGQTIHAHPTLSEIMAEAMLAADGKAIAY